MGKNKSTSTTPSATKLRKELMLKNKELGALRRQLSRVKGIYEKQKSDEDFKYFIGTSVLLIVVSGLFFWAGTIIGQ